MSDRPFTIKTKVGVTIEVTEVEAGGKGLRFIPMTRALGLTVEESRKLALVLLGAEKLPLLEKWLAEHLEDLLDPARQDKTHDELKDE